MKNLVVFAHPNQESFGKGIVNIIVKASKEKKDEVVVRDLYQIGFDPILKSSDFEAFKSGKVPEDILTEQQHIKWADMIIFVYPVWWSSMPAMLQGYVDRVFSYGFAYEYTDGTARGLLKDKRALLFSTTGTSSQVYDENGMTEAMKQTKDEGIFGFCGITDVKHVFFGAVPYVDEDMRENYLEEVDRVIKEIKETSMTR